MSMKSVTIVNRMAMTASFDGRLTKQTNKFADTDPRRNCYLFATDCQSGIPAHHRYVETAFEVLS
ncbi:MAG: hypothetical protein K6F46_05570, partial [Desulfovibrio sp.]|nr:hypothetical protein [Desulfovibrio sp.]